MARGSFHGEDSAAPYASRTHLGEDMEDAPGEGFIKKGS